MSTSEFPEFRETTDPDGRRVVFDAGTYLHLAIRRPWMLDHRDAIIAAVRSPDFRATDPTPGRERFFQMHLDEKRWMQVVVDFNESPAWIVTAMIEKNDPRRYGK